MDIIAGTWNNVPFKQDSDLSINCKFKNALKKWSKNLSNLNKILSNCNYTLALLDGLEEQRDLSIMERYFRLIIKKHTQKLLEAKTIYWKSRAKIRWAQLGDENSKKNHTIATQSYRINYITSINDMNGKYIKNHDHKAVIILNSYKERLGISIDPMMTFDLDTLVTIHALSHLDDPFTAEEIVVVLKEIPTNRALGPAGFNGLFMKNARS
jgi:hypothetical protein